MLNFGLCNYDIQGDFSFWFCYDFFCLGDLFISGGCLFQVINEFDVYLNLLCFSNYILFDVVWVIYVIEIVNGLCIYISFDWNDWCFIIIYDVGFFLGDVVEDDDLLMDFECYQVFIMINILSFMFGQCYMCEFNCKVILGSKWFILSLMYC